MVLKPEPFFAAFESIPREPASPVLLTTPEGVTFKQEHAQAFSKERDVTLFCGHYEGFDERIRTLATMELSLGDFVLTGGELPSLAVIDATARLVPGVVGKHLSVFEESFADGLLEGPAYTKPPEFRGLEVPEVLRGGNHKEITRWRRQQALKRTLERRPDLLANAKLNREDVTYLRTLGYQQ